jgi:hypothetical protein
MSPALSFQGGWLDKLLSGSKQQTTRQQTDRIKVDDIVHIYNQQRKRITDKPLRHLTEAGMAMVQEGYPFIKSEMYADGFHAHFLGKVVITQVRNIIPIEMCGDDLNAWAVADGFADFATARCWFEIRYGAQWMHQRWTVIKWDGWLERYFEPEE